ncbi:hypothetical protein [Mesorhizobium kowhaii]|uniref:Uncharacterized protein n=1 Tax=Mesorhizobium kowhaii TaxID=1300272 RepID=A0A2W7BWY6_9HYPH|nr:hypothetical protein [Mesorhizobium kowhaii]PZV35340.1 hypothetical protein B5V02_27565 [Mesorhizobium kowhaii]
MGHAEYAAALGLSPVQRRAEAGDRVGDREAWRRRGAGLSPPWRRHQHGVPLAVELGLTARKAPQLATVVLADGAENELPALAALRDLVQSPDGMMAIELADGRRVSAPAGSTPAAVKRQLAGIRVGRMEPIFELGDM